MSKLSDKKPRYTYNDIMITPAMLSTIRHRSECNPYDNNGMLPLFTAPMDSVVDESNYEKFKENLITPIIPRTVKIGDRMSLAGMGEWVAVSMDEFDQFFINEGNPIISLTVDNAKFHILIDIANGHIAALYELVREAKKIHGDDIEIMVGNIANPETYRICVESNVDYVRCSVGTGFCCTTCSNTSIGYPAASLIDEIASIKREYVEKGIPYNELPKIVADGGMRNYSDIIKALALGADYVMCGSIFSKMMESSAAKVYNYPVGNTKSAKLRFPRERYENLRYVNGNWYGTYTDEFINHLKEMGRNVDKEERQIGDVCANIYGMASREGQIAMNGKKTHTSEGIAKKISVEYTMSQWVENMTDFLRSAMSYTNSRTLSELREASVEIVSKNSFEAVNR